MVLITMTMSNDKDNTTDGHIAKYLVYVLMVFISVAILVGIVFVLQHGMILDKVEQIVGDQNALIKQYVKDERDSDRERETILNETLNLSKTTNEILKIVEKDLLNDVNISKHNSEKLDKILELLQNQ